jgi:ferredoxin-NADP reductase
MATRGKSSATRVIEPTVWTTATVASVAHQNSRLVMLRLDVKDRQDHVPGQHYVVRLTAEDGYTASRSYSIASSPNDPQVELAVERLEDGEVSGFLAEVVQPGDDLEVRGPIGGWFIWPAETPAVGIGGGTGVVPFLSMLRYARELGRADLLKLAVSARTKLDLPYVDEVMAAGALIAITRQPTLPPERPKGRLAAADLEPLLTPGATYFVCGSAVFAEAATQLLIGLGVAATDIKVERFGPSG